MDTSGIMDEMMGPLEDVFKDLQQKWRELNDQEPFWSIVGGFIHAIDWREPWLMGILAFEFLLLLMAILTRKQSGVQTAIFFTAAGIVYVAERLNAVGQKHWEEFASQNYFDKQGIFFSAVISGPLLLIVFIVLINYLVACTTMLIQAKRQELKYRAQQRSKQEGKGGVAGPAKGKKDT